MFPYHHNGNAIFKCLSRDDSLLKLQMHQILSQSFSGRGVNKYIPEVAKLLVHPDIVIKKMACWFLGRHCTDSNEVLLILNSLFGYLKHPNPVLKILALQTLVLLPLENQIELVLSQLMQCLDNSNPLVRRAAVMSCSKIYRDHRISKEDGHLLMVKFKSMATDPDALVSLNVNGALKEMLELQGGTFVISKPIAVLITSSLEKYPSLVRTRAIHLLCSYEVTTPEETLDLMNALDGHLKAHVCPSTHAAMLSLFVSIVRVHLPHLYNEVIIRFKSVVLNDLNFESKDIVYGIFKYLKPLVKGSRELFAEDVQLFLCQQSDPLYIKNEKMDILLSLICSKSQKKIISNVLDTFRLEHHQTQLKVVGILSKMFQLKCISSVKSLIDLMSGEDSRLSSFILDELALLRYEDEQKAMENDIVKVMMDWILQAEVNQRLNASLITFLGFYYDHKIENGCFVESDCNSKSSEDESKGKEPELKDIIDKIYDPDGNAFENNDIYTNSGKCQAKSNSCSNSIHNANDINDWVDQVIYKMEYIFKKINITDHFCDTNGEVSYKVPGECLSLLSALLTTFLKYFVERPAQCQSILIDLFDICSKVDSPMLRHKCFIYKKMLAGNVSLIEDHFREVAQMWHNL